jgi:Bifunctional DNA primase/polymerase, N-terminal
VDTIRENLLTWALHFATRGWHVFPTTPGAKKPPGLNRWKTRPAPTPTRSTARAASVRAGHHHRRRRAVGVHRTRPLHRSTST